MIKKYKIFFTPMCPKCPAIKEFLNGISLEGEFVDCATKDGLEKAREYGVTNVPTVLFFDDKGELAGEAHNIIEVRRVVENRTLSDI